MDDPESTTALIVYVLALFFTWLFARAERTLTLRSQATIERLLEQAKPWGHDFLAHTTTKRRIILALGTGSLVAELALVVSAFMTAERYSLAGYFHPAVGHVLAGLVSLLPLAWFHFILPSTKALDDIPLNRVRFYAPIIMLWTIICWPLVWPMDRLLMHLSRQPHGREAREEALMALVEDDSEEGIIEADKREMISSIMNIDETTVKEVMVPRVDIVAIERTRNVAELLALFAETQHSRVPIYEDRMDNIIGIVHAKDVLQAAFTEKDTDFEHLNVDVFARESAVLFVPTSKKIDELLRELRREKKHMAIAVDEYGGTAGIVTMEDILEEIVGEIQDEYDEEEELPYRWINGQQMEVDAGIDIADLNEALGSDLPEENGYETLGGFLYHQFSAIPEMGSEIRYGIYRMVVRNVSSQRIDKVLIEKVESSDDTSSGEGSESGS